MNVSCNILESYQVVIELFAQESCPVFSKIRFLCFTFGKFCQFNDSVEVKYQGMRWIPVMFVFTVTCFQKKKKKGKNSNQMGENWNIDNA